MASRCRVPCKNILLRNSPLSPALINPLDSLSNPPHTVTNPPINVKEPTHNITRPGTAFPESIPTPGKTVQIQWCAIGVGIRAQPISQTLSSMWWNGVIESSPIKPRRQSLSYFGPSTSETTLQLTGHTKKLKAPKNNVCRSPELLRCTSGTSWTPQTGGFESFFLKHWGPMSFT